jgi:hypothetical protein
MIRLPSRCSDLQRRLEVYWGKLIPLTGGLPELSASHTVHRHSRVSWGFSNPDGLVGDDLVSARLADNAAWIREMMAQGRTIVDMGP